MIEEKLKRLIISGEKHLTIQRLWGREKMRKEDVEKRIELMGKRRRTALKILISISMILLLIVSLILFLVYYVKIGSALLHYLPLPLSSLIEAISLVLAIFIVITILLYLDFRIRKRWLEESLKPKPTFYKGKRLYVFTYPQGAKGGVFARTFIDIDDKTVINLRCQIIKPQEIWK